MGLLAKAFKSIEKTLIRPVTDAITGAKTRQVVAHAAENAANAAAGAANAANQAITDVNIPQLVEDVQSTVPVVAAVHFVVTAAVSYKLLNVLGRMADSLADVAFAHRSTTLCQFIAGLYHDARQRPSYRDMVVVVDSDFLANALRGILEEKPKMSAALDDYSLQLVSLHQLESTTVVLGSRGRPVLLQFLTSCAKIEFEHLTLPDFQLQHLPPGTASKAALEPRWIARCDTSNPNIRDGTNVMSVQAFAAPEGTQIQRITVVQWSYAPGWKDGGVALGMAAAVWAPGMAAWGTWAGTVLCTTPVGVVAAGPLSVAAVGTVAYYGGRRVIQNRRQKRAQEAVRAHL